MSPLRATQRSSGRFIQSLALNRDGSVGPLFGLMAVVFCFCIGAAVDYSRWYFARRITLAAMDTAVLAGGRSLQVNATDIAKAKATAAKFYSENIKNRMPLVSDTITFTPADNNTAFIASGNAYISTTFMRLANITQLPLLGTVGSTYSKSVLAAGANAERNLEISLILDVTGSMTGSKITDLKDAAKDLVDIVIWEDQSVYKSRVALVPYASSVNAGSYANTVRGAISSGTCTSPGCDKFKFTNADDDDRTLSITNCVSERTTTANPLTAYTDAAPVTVAGVGTNMLGRVYAPSSNPCVASTVVPMSKDKDYLKGQIDALTAGGSTGGHIGVAWGWYTLSPLWNTIWPSDSDAAAYGTAKLDKIAVLMTDGEYNSSYCKGVISKDSTSGSGSDDDHINCNAHNGHAFSQAVTMCGAMRTAGITVYTVGFDVVNDQRARDLMTQCATSTSHVYLVDDGEQLKQAFRDIALKVSTLYLSQ